ncbi:hypothetical protein BJ508DRAFT_111582 [Ascobolus immersus RN42]|uniref:CSN8/PSMD8/EIF3K domain-containing protein n=1 Tax=Ascobolus immersus RN42 TaxID=1160509 RepID=A0A3N4I832_ASCIM|nr:hypothetical protein BJ508DRAFT_111582 [Ascobolus immersus RN42]
MATSTSTEALSTAYHSLRNAFSSSDYEKCLSLLPQLKLALLHNNALLPSPTTPLPTLLAARDILELAALTSIHVSDGAAFARYFAQLAPFYEDARLGRSEMRNRVVGLQLLLLLSQNSIAEFHTLLETLEMEGAQNGGRPEDDVYVRYPVMLERWLMEGSYDKVWEATRGGKVPSEEYALFSTVLVGTIRNEIASCSERAYTSIPISNAKNLLFLESEGAVIEFARERGWLVKDSRIWFPSEEGDKEVLNSESIIENTLGYARELETIV